MGRKKKPDNEAAVRMSITVDPRLKSQMDDATKHEKVNWSAVASAAFEDKVAQIAATKSDLNDEEISIRLRASKRETVDADHEYGILLGREWASKVASFELLLNLEKNCGKVSEPEWRELEQPTQSDVFENLLLRIDADWFDDVNHLQWMWDGLSSRPDDTTLRKTSFAQGFLAGALETWARVKDQI